MTAFKLKEQYVLLRGNYTQWVNPQGKAVECPIDLVADNYQTRLFNQDVAFAVTHGVIHKAWNTVSKRMYTPLPADYKLGPPQQDTIKKLINLHFQDAGRSQEFVDMFWAGKLPVELVATDGGIIALYDEELLSEKTKDELLRIAYDRGLFEYVKSSMTADQIKLSILEHQEQ
jgi:hypothetical protein